MASLTDFYDGPLKVIRDPSSGIVTFSGKEGTFSVYFYTEQDERGNVTKRGFSAPIHSPRFLVVSVGFFRIVGGRPDRKDPSKFISVYSPIVCWDKGYGWNQFIPVWVFTNNPTKPSYYGTWSELKERIEAHGGRYAEVLFVVAPEHPDKLLRLELTGRSISQLKEALKSFRVSKVASLVKGPHILEMEGTEPYEIGGRQFFKPVFRVSAFTKDSKGYDQFYPLLLDFSRRVDEYGDALAAKQKSDDPTNDGSSAAKQQHSRKPSGAFLNWMAEKNDTDGQKPPQGDETLFEDLPF